MKSERLINFIFLNAYWLLRVESDEWEKSKFNTESSEQFFIYQACLIIINYICIELLINYWHEIWRLLPVDPACPMTMIELAVRGATSLENNN